MLCRASSRSIYGGEYLQPTHSVSPVPTVYLHIPAHTIGCSQDLAGSSIVAFILLVASVLYARDLSAIDNDEQFDLCRFRLTSFRVSLVLALFCVAAVALSGVPLYFFWRAGRRSRLDNIRHPLLC
jgi:hypothetical protein